MIDLIVGLGSFVFFITLGLVFGRMAERNHLASIETRLAQLTDMLVTDLRRPTAPDPQQTGAEVLYGEVVIGSDYLKTWLAGLRNFFGGEVKSFERLLFRAREEARLRVLEQARARGYNAVCNLRMEFTGLGGSSSSNKGAPMVGILCWGTAYHTAPTAV